MVTRVDANCQNLEAIKVIDNKAEYIDIIKNESDIASHLML